MPRKTAIPSTKDALLDEFQALVSDTEKLLQHSASLAGEHAEALRDDIRGSLDRARDALHKAESGLREQGKIAVDATEDYVHKHPWQALGLSAAIGLVLGLLISRR
nr:YqjD family protein [Pseudomonas oleovorans]